MKVDLRSDTVTQPTPEMLAAMTAAQTGDDVFDEDPTANAFQQKISSYFGFEAGLFVPSGTMSNQLALAAQCSAGEEVIIDELGHIYHYETAAASKIANVQLRPLAGKNGKINPSLVEKALRPRNNWDPYSKLLALEQTTNKGGGAFYTKTELQDLSDFSKKHSLILHVDGARIWNALHESDLEAKDYGALADSMSVCFSKGLGAPVGSMLLGSSEMVRRAKRWRKMLGGGMRQVGLLAAAADYAVDKHFDLLKEDHRRAKLFAQRLAKDVRFEIDPDQVWTNIVLFDVKDGNTAEYWLQRFAEFTIFMVPFGVKTIRATFHHQVGDQHLDHVLQSFDKL